MVIRNASLKENRLRSGVALEVDFHSISVHPERIFCFRFSVSWSFPLAEWHYGLPILKMPLRTLGEIAILTVFARLATMDADGDRRRYGIVDLDASGFRLHPGSA